MRRRVTARSRRFARRHIAAAATALERVGNHGRVSGLDPDGPVSPVAERAIQIGSPEELVALLTSRVEEELRARFEHVLALKTRADGGLDDTGPTSRRCSTSRS